MTVLLDPGLQLAHLLALRRQLEAHLADPPMLVHPDGTRTPMLETSTRRALEEVNAAIARETRH